MNLAERGIIIRKTAENDLREIYLMAVNTPCKNNVRFDAETLADLFISESSIMFSAVRKKRVLGFISGGIKNSISEISYLHVQEKLRNAGIGTALIEKFMKCAVKMGSTGFSAEVPQGGSELIKFLNRKGFTQNGHIVILAKSETSHKGGEDSNIEPPLQQQ